MTKFRGLLPAFLLTGCATIFTGTTDTPRRVRHVDASIVRLRSDFDQWPGVISDR